MKIVTCVTNTDQVGYVNGLVASCIFFNLNLVTLQSESWVSHRQKDILFRDYLLTIDSQEVVFFTDAYDVIMVGNEKEILERYTKLSEPGKIIVSADRICSPGQELGKYFDPKSTGYSFINTGGMIGKVVDFLTLLNKVFTTELKDKSRQNKEYSWSNQYLWIKTIIQEPNLIVIDSKCEIFQTFTSAKSIQNLYEFVNNEPELLEEEDLYKRKSLTDTIEAILEEVKITDDYRIYNKSTKTYPVQIHFNTKINKLVMFMEPFVKLVDKFNNSN
jgi:hypothetical protein